MNVVCLEPPFNFSSPNMTPSKVPVNNSSISGRLFDVLEIRNQEHIGDENGAGVDLTTQTRLGLCYTLEMLSEQ